MNAEISERLEFILSFAYRLSLKIDCNLLIDLEL